MTEGPKDAIDQVKGIVWRLHKEAAEIAKDDAEVAGLLRASADRLSDDLKRVDKERRGRKPK